MTPMNSWALCSLILLCASLEQPGSSVLSQENLYSYLLTHSTEDIRRPPLEQPAGFLDIDPALTAVITSIIANYSMLIIELGLYPVTSAYKQKCK